MAALACILFSSSPSLPSSGLTVGRRVLPSVSIATPDQWRRSADSRRMLGIVRASDSSIFQFGGDDEIPKSKDPVIFKLIRDIEPLDVSLIQKDVPPTTIDAMKRTISGMLGLLPSDQFQVTVEALWKPIFRLLISSMMTGYTLRNAEYRLSLERNLEIHVGSNNSQKTEDIHGDSPGQHLEDKVTAENFNQVSLWSAIPELKETTPEVRKYISDLHSRLSSLKKVSSLKKELHEVKRKSAALQMQQFVGEEKNELLDYLRSLQPEKVAELSEPTSPELKDTIHSVVHGLLATLSPKMHSKGSQPRESSSLNPPNIETEGDHVDLIENTSLNFEPLISLPRDYLARLLFWCMLLGHYLRGLEYRLELMELLSLPCSPENQAGPRDEQAA